MRAPDNGFILHGPEPSAIPDRETVETGLKPKRGERRRFYDLPPGIEGPE